MVFALLGVGGAIAAAFWNTGKPLGTPSSTETTSTPAQPADQHEVALTAATKRQVHATLAHFVATAVTRRNVEEAFGLVTPNLREGMSRRKWAKGDIPVYPYPARDPIEISRYVGSFKNDVLLDVLLQPRKSAKNVGPILFEVEMKAVGAGPRKRWLVDSFVPSQAFSPASSPPPKVNPKPSATPKAQTASRGPDYGAGHLSARWFLIPVLILGLILLIPLGLAVRSWLAGRRAAREYSRDRPLPPLPKRE